MQTGSGNDQAALDFTLKYNPPMDHAAAERNLKQLKSILDGLGVVFMMGSGSCLGAVRDGAFIPWDDDIDLVTVLGVNGTTEQSIETTTEAFRAAGYHADRLDGTGSSTVMTMRDGVRVSLEWLRISGDHVLTYPGILLPTSMFTQPKEIDFLASGSTCRTRRRSIYP